MSRTPWAPSATTGEGDTIEAQILLACLHQDPNRLDESGVGNLGAAQWEHFVTLAGYQRVRPLVHQRLFESGRWKQAPAGVWRRLESECRAIALKEVRMHAELSQILAELAAHRVPAIVLKGAYLGPAVYQNIALREMNDLDIMVPRDQLDSVVTLVSARGYEGLHAFSVEADARASHHVTRLMKRGVAGVEIHWTLTPPYEATAIDPQQLWQRARPVVLHGVEALSLSPVDLLLHLCIHTSFLHQFEFGLRPSCDIARVITHCGADLDWDELAQTAEQRGWSRGVALALRLARDLVGARVPENVIRWLAPTDVDAALPIAKQLVWATPSEIGAFARNLAGLGGDTCWRVRLDAARRRVFLSKSELIATCRVSTDRPWWRLLYARRLLSLLRRYSGASLRLLSGRDPLINELARRRNLIRTWLSQAE